MVYLDPVAVVAEGVPWWVILLAVLAGLLVLALLVLLLWKVRPGEGWSQWELGLEEGGWPLTHTGSSSSSYRENSVCSGYFGVGSPADLVLKACVVQWECGSLVVKDGAEVSS